MPFSGRFQRHPLPAKVTYRCRGTSWVPEGSWALPCRAFLITFPAVQSSFWNTRPRRRSTPSRHASSFTLTKRQKRPQGGALHPPPCSVPTRTTAALLLPAPTTLPALNFLKARRYPARLVAGAAAFCLRHHHGGIRWQEEVAEVAGRVFFHGAAVMVE